MAEELPFKKTMIFAYGVPRELAPGVVRIVANNPNHFTFKGTNTYLLGTGSSLALIDPGPDDPAHLKAILDTVGERKISHVIITHTHRDHTDGMPALLAATGAKTVGYGRRVANRGTSDRVHMVIDAQVNGWIRNLLEGAAGGYAAPRSAASGASVTS